MLIKRKLPLQSKIKIILMSMGRIHHIQTIMTMEVESINEQNRFNIDEIK